MNITLNFHFFVVYCNKLIYTISYYCLLYYITAQCNLLLYTALHYSILTKLTKNIDVLSKIIICFIYCTFTLQYYFLLYIE